MNGYTKTTSYLAPMIEQNLSVFLEHNFVNCYLGDDGYDIKYPNHLYLRVAPSEFTDKFRDVTREVRNSKEYVADYDLPNREVMFVFKISETYYGDLELFKAGKYGKINKEYVERSFKKDSKRYKVLNKDPEYRAMLEETLDVHLPANAELEELPIPEHEIFRNSNRGWN